MSDLKPCWSCGSRNVGPTGGMNIIMCGDCGAGPDEEWIWQSRALAPALDRVIAEVEARGWSGMSTLLMRADDDLRERSGGGPVHLSERFLAHLRALRDSASETGEQTDV